MESPRGGKMISTVKLVIAGVFGSLLLAAVLLRGTGTGTGPSDGEVQLPPAFLNSKILPFHLNGKPQ
jgi:hypothetical protein